MTSVEEFDRARAGDREAWARIVEENGGLAWAYALEYGNRHRSLSREDCVAAAMAGLAKAAVRYDPRRTGKDGRPAAFSTAAYYWMRLECQHRSAEDDRRATAGVSVTYLRGNARRFSAAAQAAAESVKCGSLPTGYDPGRASDSHEEVDTADTLRLVWATVDRYPEPVASILRLHYREGVGQPEIGERLGVTRQRVQQILAKGLQQLRRDLGRIA